MGVATAALYRYLPGVAQHTLNSFRFCECVCRGGRGRGGGGGCWGVRGKGDDDIDNKIKNADKRAVLVYSFTVCV